MNTYLGVDPGSATGAISFVDELGRLIASLDLPVIGDARRGISAPLLADMIKRQAPAGAAVESAGPRPLEGRASIFKFAYACGTITGVIATLGIPLTFVAPGVWRRHFRLAPGKESSRQKAHETWPAEAGTYFSRRKDIHRCESALIGLWLVRTEIVASRDAAP